MISVIVPVYKGEPFLESLFTHMKNQSYSNWELIIIIDGSPDNSYEIAKKHALVDSRIKVFEKENGGICSARNYGIGKATGDYISFIDQDDEPMPNMLSDLIRYASDDIDLVVGGKELNIYFDDECEEKCLYQYEYCVLSDEKLLKYVLNFNNNNAVQHIWNGLYKKRIIDQNNVRFNESFHYGMEDTLFNMDYCRFVKNIAMIPEIVYRYIKRRGISTSSKPNPEMLYSYEALLTSMSSFLESKKYSITNDCIVYSYRLMKNIFVDNSFQEGDIATLKKMFSIHRHFVGGRIELKNCSYSRKEYYEIIFFDFVVRHNWYYVLILFKNIIGLKRIKKELKM